MDKQSMRMDDSRWAHDMRPTPTRPPYGERMMKWFDYDHVRRIRAKYAAASRPAPTKLDLYHRAVEDGIVPPVEPMQ